MCGKKGAPPLSAIPEWRRGPQRVSMSFMSCMHMRTTLDGQDGAYPREAFGHSDLAQASVETTT